MKYSNILLLTLYSYDSRTQGLFKLQYTGEAWYV